MNTAIEIEENGTRAQEEEEETPEQVLDEEMSLEQSMQLGYAYLTEFESTGDTEDAEQAIHYHELAISLAPDNHSYKPFLLNNLGNCYQCLFGLYGQVEHIDEAIKCQKMAVQLTSESDSEGQLQAWLNNLGHSHLFRFERFGKLDDIKKSIEFLDQALQLTPEDHSDRPPLLHNLGNSYSRKFEHTGDTAYINKAIEYHHQALALTQDDSEDKPGLLNDLGNSYLRLFERLGVIADIDRAIEYQNQAVELNRGSGEDKASALNNLGSSHLRRFQRNGHISDLEKSIDCHNQALSLTHDDRANKPMYLNNLGSTHECQFEHFGDLEDIKMAIDYRIQAVLLTPDGHPEKPTWMISLGNSYASHFRCVGELDRLEAAIKWQTGAVRLIPDKHPTKPGFLNNLGNSHMHRFERLGELIDIDRAIECHIHAVQLAPENTSDRPTLFSNLGTSYRCRFDRLRELSDIDKAIEYQSQAVSLTPDDHAGKPTLLGDLGISYTHRSRFDNNVEDVDEAIKCHTQAVQLIPKGHADRPSGLNNLGHSYMRRCEQLGELEDINQAIECLHQAVQLTTDQHPAKLARLTNLGGSYVYRFEILRTVTDIEKAIECHSQVVKLTPEGHANKPSHLENLAKAYLRRFQNYGDTGDAQAASKHFQTAAQHIITRPSVQLGSARAWVECSNILGVSPRSAYQRCMELVPQLVWLGVTIEKRYELVGEISDLAMVAAAWAISIQANELALEWLEEGRTIVWNQILQLRTPFSDLSLVNPTLAQDLHRVGRELHSAGSRLADTDISIGSSLHLEQAAQYHHRLATDWDQLINQARNIPGFHDFMRPRRAADLMPAAKDGPIVLINVHTSRCDALIIQPNKHDIAHVPLGKFSQDKAMHVRTRIGSVAGREGSSPQTRYVGRLQPKPQQSFSAMLLTLWSDVVKPILDFLGYTPKQSAHGMPHITWCTTGALSFLPLHATGCYDGSNSNVFDFVVSSYTPTLSTLLNSSLPVPGSDSGILAVGQEDTPGQNPLPYTRVELGIIQAHARNIPYLQLEDEKATVEAVLDGMEKHSWVHLACHATQQTDNPAESAFHLHDGQLMLSAITKRSFKNKGLAFLSACQTATGSKELPDEAVHLAAGMLMAGYPSVIATMWTINDEDGPEIAQEVYADLLKGGDMNCSHAARALHAAVGYLRTKLGEQSFEQWVPFIHIGI